MALVEIQLLLPAAGLDAWSDAILAAGAASVAIEDGESDTQEETPLYGEPGMAPRDPAWRSNRVAVLLEAHIDVVALLEGVSRALGAPVPAVLQRRPVAEHDWVRQTQAQFAPFAVGRLWIVPTWHTPPDPTACNLRIDPGVAFGTGTHPTTQLCLAWLDAHRPAGARVLDYGCGSGILSIAAALLGATEVVGVDIDTQAIAAARGNADHNQVRAHYTTPETFAADAARQFDLVIANILTNPLILLAPTLVRRLGPGARLLLSGILERQATAVVDAYRAVDPALSLQALPAQEGWVALTGTRAAPTVLPARAAPGFLPQ